MALQNLVAFPIRQTSPPQDTYFSACFEFFICLFIVSSNSFTSNMVLLLCLPITSRVPTTQTNGHPTTLHHYSYFPSARYECIFVLCSHCFMVDSAVSGVPPSSDLPGLIALHTHCTSIFFPSYLIVLSRVSYVRRWATLPTCSTVPAREHSPCAVPSMMPRLLEGPFVLVYVHFASMAAAFFFSLLLSLAPPFRHE